MLKGLVLCASLLLIVSVVYAETKPASTPAKVTQEELARARKANDDAQAEYYRELTKKLHQSSPTPAQKTLRQSVAENPGSFFGIFSAIIAALFAAIVGLLTLYVNNRATRRLQRDTQFYEALKRFGDKDSATMRSSAAGLLAQMGKTRIGLGRRRPYVGTALDQLISGLLLEENGVSLITIGEALKQLVTFTPNTASNLLRIANRSLQEDMAGVIRKFLIASGTTQPGLIDPELWTKAATLLGYEETVLKEIVSEENFAEHFEADRRAFDALGAEKRVEHLVLVQESLLMLSKRMRVNVDVFSLLLTRFGVSAGLVSTARLSFKAMIKAHATGSFWTDVARQIRLFRGSYKGKLASDVIQYSFPNLVDLFLAEASLRYSYLRLVLMSGAQLQGADISRAELHIVDLSNSSLERANLSWSKLKGLDLTEANLKGTNLKGSELDNTLLYGAKVDGETTLEDANWWKANFFKPPEGDFYFMELVRHPLKSGKSRGPEQEHILDLELLKKLYERYKADIPSNAELLHPSVRSFLNQMSSTAIASDNAVVK